MAQSFKSTLVLIVEVKGRKHRLHISTAEFDSAEGARDFSEQLLSSGIIVGYRVIYQISSGGWYHHKFVKFVPDELAKLPTLDHQALANLIEVGPSR